MKHLFLLLATLFIVNDAVAQDRKLKLTPNIGISSHLLSSGIGFNAALNASIPMWSRFSLEGQVAYNYTDISRAFISGKTFYVQGGNLYAGVRYYFFPFERPSNWYANLLIGGYHSRQSNLASSTTDFGMSLGFFYERNKLMAGVSIEQPGELVLKFGYILE